MRRETLLKALVAIEAALKKSGARQIFTFLSRMGTEREAKPVQFLAEALNGYASFMISYQSFSLEEKQVLAEFELEFLTQSEAWVTHHKPTPDGPSQALKIRFVLETFPKFSKILRRDLEKMDFIVPSTDQKTEQTLPTKRMTFLIRELDKPTLTLKDFGSIVGVSRASFRPFSR
jgi:hypothetical protein